MSATRVILTAFNEGGELEIYLSRQDDRFKGKVRRTVRSGKTSVGVTDALEPVFIRVCNAQQIAELKSVWTAIMEKQELTSAQKELAVDYAFKELERVNDRLLNWAKEKIDDLRRLTQKGNFQVHRADKVAA